MESNRNGAAAGDTADALNRVDLCFVVDTTGSMSPFLQVAQRRLVETLEALRSEGGLDLMVGLVEYRDHPPQERTFVTRAHPPTTDLAKMQKVINGLQAMGGGDAPEAVYDGIRDACEQMSWRAHSCRFALLVGDAPPHGAKAHLPDAAPQPAEAETAGNRRRNHQTPQRDVCPCGLTVHSVTAAAESRNVTVHALCMTEYPATVEAFTAIASGTGGECAPAQSADKIVGTMMQVLRREFGNLPFDRQVLDLVRSTPNSWDTAFVAERLGCPRGRAAASLARLGKRGFLDMVGVGEATESLVPVA